MTTRTVAATALGATALVMLTACGGGGGDKNADKIPTATTSAPSSATPTPSATTPGVQRPVITFPAGSKTVYENQHTGDPKKDAVLSDEAHANDSAYAAVLEGKNRTPAMEFYNSGLALRGAVDFVQGWLDKGNTWIGTITYSDRKVTLRGDSSAVVIYCSDESRAFTKNRKTGKVDNTPTTADSYVLYNERLQKNPQGVWILVSVLSNRGAKECQP
ncbi:hypothetical protein AB0M29_22500 [Streptomyces sp. NPDC051976]|uniref:hypothetical protein n=1 Tax=Streptomyces sp. NPDC051976 TaxID=3154947 RepID=UPI00342691C4